MPTGYGPPTPSGSAAYIAMTVMAIWTVVGMWFLFDYMGRAEIERQRAIPLNIESLDR